MYSGIFILYFEFIAPCIHKAKLTLKEFGVRYLLYLHEQHEFYDMQESRYVREL